MFGKHCTFIAIALSTLFPSLEAEEDNNALMQNEIKHVVLLMLENRSFDNVLAWLYGNDDAPNYFIPKSSHQNYLGFTDETLSQYTNSVKDSSGQIIFSSSPVKGIPSVENEPYINSPSTDPNEPFNYVTNQVFGFDGGTHPTMSGFLQDYANLWDQNTWLHDKIDICAVMETYTDKELPVMYGLAKHYAVSDLWFSSVPSQTNPNRAFAACGTSEGQVQNGPVGKSLFYSDTIWNRLTEESPETTWTIFWHSDMIPGLIRGPYTGTNTFASLGRIPDLDSHYQMMDSFHDLARKGKLPDFSFIEPQWTLSENLSSKDLFLEYFSENQNMIVGLQGNDLHPPGDVRTAENFLANVYTSLIANKEAWSQTLLIITFDEHGGLYDHVPPPDSISPDEHFENGFKFDRYGVRVPAIFISPKINKRTVIRSEKATIPFDHTSLIATILKWKNIDKAKWKMGNRVDAAPTFENVITLADSRQDVVLKPDSIILPQVNKSNVVQMSDKFYLRGKNGNYLANSKFLFKADARLGSSNDKVALSFVGGQGSITHGSFILIESNDKDLGDANLLGTSTFRTDCIYAANSHEPGQWWTIKSADKPYVGAEIQYGDRVYLENHIYLDPFNYIPSRLTIDNSIFGEFIKTLPITDKNSDDYYWILEKADNSNLKLKPYQVNS